MTEHPFPSVELITIAEVQARTPSLDESDQTILYQALNAAVRRVAPCLAVQTLSDDQRAEAREILVRVIRRQEDVDSWVESITTGPYGTKLRASAVSISVLAPDDESALRALCGTGPVAASGGAGPRGSFPPPPIGGRFSW